MFNKSDRVAYPSGNRIFKNSSCIVLGGGITGLITAKILQREGIEVTVLDKGRGIGGRLATRRINRGEPNEGVFDYGTQYFSVEHPILQPWIDDWLQQGSVKKWFVTGSNSTGYCGVNGMREIAKYLARDLNVRTGTKVVKLSYDKQWLVETEGDYPKGTLRDRSTHADILVMTPPVPQSLALLDASEITLPSDIRSLLDRISYYSCIAVLALLAQPSKILAPGGIALENESLVWLADNYQKGISPNGYAVTLHATPKFSDTHWDSDDAEIADKLFKAASDYLGSPPIQYQVHRWRYSLPKTFYHQPYLALTELPLVLAGDAFVAPKIEGAMLSGIAAGESIIASKFITKIREGRESSQ